MSARPNRGEEYITSVPAGPPDTRTLFAGGDSSGGMQPTVLLTHRILGGGGPVLADEIAERVPETDLRVAKSDDETRTHLPEAEVLVTQRFEESFLDDADELAWIQGLSAGYDMYPLDRLESMGVRLTNASGVHAEPIGEQILGYLLVFERNIHTGVHQQRDGVWQQYYGGELADQTVGIVGLGAIGTRAAELCSGVGMEVLGTKRDLSEAPDAADEVFAPDDLDELLARSDYVVLACPLTEETEGLLDRAAFERMPDSGVVVNIARGGILVQDDLVAALEDGELRGAALDVFDEEPLPEESPLWDRRDVVLTPHMAGSTPHYWERCADIFAENYERFLAGEALRNRIVP
jgi:phosphoglycerate dehydrogenase-like enzyme